MENLLAGALIFLGGLFCHSFLPSYMKKKGENLATHEDLQQLVEQVRQTAETTKSIEERITDEYWTKQRQWELKKEALLEGSRAVADFLASVTRLNAVFAVVYEEPDLKQALGKLQNKAMDELNQASYSFQRAQIIVSVVSSKSTQMCFVAMEKLLKNASAKIVDGDAEGYKQFMPLIKVAATAITNSIRSELGMTLQDEPLTSLSNGSSTVPTPLAPTPEASTQKHH